ncbi:MAG: copper-containing nitrite reductase [Armatimonadota bacterium]|nr:copper-containing nitrite reductase [Armatimonadota bacterium]MDR7486133.1 copper-containing nitrite reductase [Armatimonadota bacterium]MDR7531764.1 copper-containing nitrite reductase [Armatimonadota bacterium]MDR7534891.1 copper-containing nitrite reductase [Armatimonadota bacterium]
MKAVWARRMWSGLVPAGIVGAVGVALLGMRLVTAGPPAAVTAQLTQVPRVPPAPGRGPTRVVVDLETVERRGALADGVEYGFWTFNGTVPGPMIRVREGDTVELRLRNRQDSTQAHSIDLHAVNGPGGGAAVTQTTPGKATAFRWQARNPGLYVYHCATPHIPSHIANGMYGLILVEPARGLPTVDVEYAVVQSEFYTQGGRGQRGLQRFDAIKAYAEQPEYVVFNGRVGALTARGALQASVGQTVRLFVGNAGPNLVSSFHVIGEIFDRVYPEGAVGTPPLRNVQTTHIPAGGAAIVEFRVEVPGTYLLVDHSIFRIDKGAVGQLVVSGPAAPQVFRPLE